MIENSPKASFVTNFRVICFAFYMYILHFVFQNNTLVFGCTVHLTCRDHLLHWQRCLIIRKLHSHTFVHVCGDVFVCTCTRCTLYGWSHNFVKWDFHGTKTPKASLYWKYKNVGALFGITKMYKLTCKVVLYWDCNSQQYTCILILDTPKCLITNQLSI